VAEDVEYRTPSIVMEYVLMGEPYAFVALTVALILDKP
jgi:hypothetical protein